MAKQQKVFTAEEKDYLSHFYFVLDTMIGAMTDARETDSVSYNFIAQMIPHHMAAIEMSNSILKYTECAPVSNLAENIVREQTKSIEKMRAITEECKMLKNPAQDRFLYRRMKNQILLEMFGAMGISEVTENINADYIREMIPHHIGAVRMAENALRFPVCPQLVPLLREIRTSQKRGICEMQRLLIKFSKLS